MSDVQYTAPPSYPYTQAGGSSGPDLVSRYLSALASIESAGSGGYAAVGPKTRTGDQAYGKYQVMGANIPGWTKEVLGRSMTPQEFLADPKAQDAVARAKFSQYVARYGSPQDAASVWFTGRPQSTGAQARDVLGTSGAQYVDKFNRALGQPTQTNGNVQQAATVPNALMQTPASRQELTMAALLGLNQPATQSAGVVPVKAAPAQPSYVEPIQGFAIRPTVDFTKVSGPASYPKFEVGKPIHVIDETGQLRRLSPVGYDPFAGEGEIG